MKLILLFVIFESAVIGLWLLRVPCHYILMYMYLCYNGESDKKESNLEKMINKRENEKELYDGKRINVLYGCKIIE